MTQISNCFQIKPPLLHDNCFIYDINDLFTFQDAIGWFIHCIQLLVSKAEHIYGEDDLDSDPDLEALPKLQELLEALANKFADMDLNDMQIDRQVDCNKATVQGIIANVHKTCFDTDQISQEGFWKNAAAAKQRSPRGPLAPLFCV